MTAPETFTTASKRASTGRRHDRSRDVHNSFKATLDHGAPSRHDRYLRKAAIRLQELTVVALTPTSVFRQTSDDNSRVIRRRNGNIRRRPLALRNDTGRRNGD